MYSRQLFCPTKLKGSNSLLKKSPWKNQAVAGTVFSYKLRYIVGFELVEMVISTNPKPTIYRDDYTGSVLYLRRGDYHR